MKLFDKVEFKGERGTVIGLNMKTNEYIVDLEAGGTILASKEKLVLVKRISCA